MRWFLAAGLCAGLLAVAFVGCGPQIKVAGDNVVAWVNAQLGELDVKKATIEGRIADAKKGLTKLRTEKIKAEVRLEGVQQKIAPLESELKRIEVAMKEVSKAAEEAKGSTELVSFNGGSYNEKQLSEMAGKVLKVYKAQADRVKAEQAGKPTLEKIAKSLATKESDYAKAISDLEDKLKEVNNKMIEVKAIRDAAAAAGDADKTIAQNFDELKDMMADFNGDLEVVLRQENAQFDDGNKAENDIKDVEKFIEASQPKTDPLAEINAILGKENK